MCPAGDPLEPDTIERSTGRDNEPVVKLDRRQRELLRSLFWNGVEPSPGDHDHKRDVFTCPFEQQHNVLLEDRREEQLRQFRKRRGVELHNGLRDARGTFRFISGERCGRNINESDVDLVELRGECLRRSFWNGIEPICRGDNHGSKLFAPHTDEQYEVLLEDRGEKQLRRFHNRIRLEFHHGLRGVRDSGRPDAVERGDRRVDEPDVELDGVECKLIPRLLRDIAEPLLCGDDSGHHLQHVRVE